MGATVGVVRKSARKETGTGMAASRLYVELKPTGYVTPFTGRSGNVLIV